MQLLGDEVKIWRDPKLQGNDYFGDTLLLRLSKIAILLCVMSPRYVRSEWCLRELGEFGKRAALNGGLRIGDKSRIFKVVKTYLPLTEHPADLQGLLGYEFYEYDHMLDRAREFNPEVLPYRDIRYWEKLEDLAYDIKQLIEILRQQHQGVEAAVQVATAGGPAPNGTGIYLAETTSDLSEERDKIKRELQQRGHVILPDRELPLKGSTLTETVREYLKRSTLSIHLIGSRYGIIPEDESRSIVELQNDVAAERGNDLSRLIWMPQGLEAQEERQQKFIDELRLGFNGHRSVELLQTKLEDLKTQIYEKLSSQQKPEVDASDAGGPRSLYLICDGQDYDDVSALESYLFEQGIEVILPVMGGDESQIAQDHKETLLQCDAVMIYYGRANEIWLRMKLRELLKLNGYGRKQPLLAKAVYVAAPQTAEKERLRTHEALIIKGYDETFSPAPLNPFLDQLRAAKGAQG
jgi:hypothetical protein